MADFSSYMFIGDPARVEALHNLTVEYKNDFLTNEHLQNVLLNHAYPMEDDERPKSFHDRHDMVWHRSVVSVSLVYLDYVLDLATNPKRADAQRSLIYQPGFRKTRAGHDVDKVRQLQAEWPYNMAVVDFLRMYREELTSAFDEFNLKSVLRKMLDVTRLGFIPEQLEEENQIRDRISEVWDGECCGALDNAYYRMAIRYMEEAGNFWGYLNNTRYGRFFIMSPEETMGLVTQIRSGGYIS